MSSSRDAPFSFSPDLRLSLGAPDALNVAVRNAFPALFDSSYAPRRASMPVTSERVGPGVGIRPGAVIPDGALVGLFSGHIFFGSGVQGSRVLQLPPLSVGGAQLALAVDGAARSSRFPSAAEAALYSHSCTAATVVGTWWMDGPVPCLVAHTSRRLTQLDRLVWDLDAHSLGGYTSSHAEARAWRRAGHRSVRCSCNRPRDCPRDRFICLADDPVSVESPVEKIRNGEAGTDILRMDNAHDDSLDNKVETSVLNSTITLLQTYTDTKQTGILKPSRI